MANPTHRHIKKALAIGSIAVVASVTAACGTEGGAAGGDATFRRPVDLVVPFGPGGGADQVARSAASVMKDSIGNNIPVINVPGATGSTGITKMLTDRPGESMAILIQDTLATVAAGGASFELDDTRAVCRLQSMPSALMVRKGTYENWDELAAEAKQSPGQLKVATVGAKSVDDIVLAAAAEAEGTEFRAVPFSEPSERYAALLGGQVDVLYEQLGDVKQYLDSGDMVPVLLVAGEPVEGYEDVPTTGDVGMPDEVVLPQFRGIIVSSDASDDVVEGLSDACADASEAPEFSEFQEQVFATDDSYQSAEDFQAFLEEQDELISAQLEKYDISE
jgi:tripartite-type tricarboxylate transporter receptor subunit TctC